MKTQQTCTCIRHFNCPKTQNKYMYLKLPLINMNAYNIIPLSLTKLHFSMSVWISGFRIEITVTMNCNRKKIISIEIIY